MSYLDCFFAVVGFCGLLYFVFCFFFQAEDGIRDAQESRGLGDVYKRQSLYNLVRSTGFEFIYI